ncbi:hypothetical protein HY988_00115 [Candidatus Micrarchaeota archaeon]|nr:hypothetical protein [Candidatus Micrarchaeota archaeon]
MNEVFRSKIRPLGTSACVLIPKEKLDEMGLTMGDEVDIALLVHRRASELEKIFGSAKGTKPFKRDKTTREFV